MENRGIESRDARRARQKHNRRRSLWILLFLAVCAGVVIALLTAPIFQIQEVYFVGNSRLTQEQLLETAAITPQQNIFAVNLSNVKKRIMEIPYVSDVDIQREFPNKIRITVHENQAAAYLYLEDQLAVIDLDGKVLELVTDAAQIQSVVQALPVSEDAEADAAASPQPSAAVDPSASPAADDTEEEADTARNRGGGYSKPRYGGRLRTGRCLTRSVCTACGRTSRDAHAGAGSLQPACGLWCNDQ